MTGMNVVEFFQDEVQFPYGGIRRVSATLAGTLLPFIWLNVVVWQELKRFQILDQG